MLGVGLHKLCPLDSFGDAFRERKLSENRPPGGCKTGPRGVQNGLWKASGRLFCASWAQLGRQGRSEAVFGRPGGALGALLALLEPSWGPPRACRAAPGRLLGVLLGPPKG